MLVTVTETTERVLGERRLRTLRDLGARAAEAQERRGGLRDRRRTLGRRALRRAVRAALPARRGRQRACAWPARGRAGESGRGAAPGRPRRARRRRGWPLAPVLQRGAAVPVDGPGGALRRLPPGPWPEPRDSAFVLPIAAPGQERPGRRPGRRREPAAARSTRRTAASSSSRRPDRDGRRQRARLRGGARSAPRRWPSSTARRRRSSRT